MRAMNNEIEKVIFYSTRQIHPFFSDSEDLSKCDSMIRYFSELKMEETTMSDFSNWLSDLAFLSEYWQKMEIIGEKMVKSGDIGTRQKLDEIHSIIYPLEDANPHEIKVKHLALLLNSHKSVNNQVTDLFWDMAFREYINLNKAQIVFEPKHFEEYKNRLLSVGTTHLNRDLTESNIEKDGSNIETNSLLIHRLGIYHKEEDGYAVAAIWPWAGDMEPNHDKNWKKTIVDSIRELYPKSNEIILVIHDNDFAELNDDEKDKIISKKETLSNWINPIVVDNFDPLVSLIVFQHTNENVLRPLKKDQEKKTTYSPKQIWEAIDKYIEKNYLLINADKDCLIAKMHNSTD